MRMEEKKSAHAGLSIDRAAFILLRVKKAFKKKKLQRKEKEKNAQQLADQRASCAGLDAAGQVGRGTKVPPGKPPLLRSRTLPAIVVPGVSILQAQIDASRCTQDGSLPAHLFSTRVGPASRNARLSFSRDDSATLDVVRRKSAISRLCSTGSSGSTAAAVNCGPERNPDGTVVLRVPAPHVVAARAYRMPSPSPGGSTAFYRLAKLLNQGPKQSSAQQHAVDDSSVFRRLSWERRDTSCSMITRSSSIDSMVDAVWTESSSGGGSSPTKRSSLLAPPRMSYADLHRPSLALVSPSVGRRMKGQRGINELPSFNNDGNNSNNSHINIYNNNNNNKYGNEMELASIQPPAIVGPPQGANKTSKKQAKLMQQRLDRLARVNIHLHALFAAIEHGHLEKARTILESTDVDVNSLNSDGLSALDVAVLSNNKSLAKMLISFGAQEGNQFKSPELLGGHLKQLLGEAEMRLQELGGGTALLEEPSESLLNTRASFSSIIGSAYPASAMTGCTGGDTDKQLVAWGRRAKVLRRMVLGFAQARPPDPPSVVAVDITATATVAVRLQEPSTPDSPLTTRYKIQWSSRADFSTISGERELLDISRPLSVVDLTHGRRFFFRAAAGNVKGYGAYVSSTPASVVPSTWREVDQREPRFEGRMKQMDQLVEEVKVARPGCELLENPSSQRRTQRKKTTIKQLFSAASKFQKNLRRGIYLACILYHDDKVLVTNEDFIPVIEIDETFPSCIHTDHHWLMKIACTWDDTKSLRADMEKNASSTVHFRTKLLSAALQMQSALCLQDLGQLYHKPLRDSQGTMVLSTINYVKTPKSVSVLNSRWLPLNKVHKKMVLSEDNNVGEILMASIQEQINYHQVSGLRLSKGLYLGYLKMQSSVDLIQVVVPTKSPNVLPHCKIRENPHVSAEEWDFIKNQHKVDAASCEHSTEQQRSFLDLVTSASKRLFKYMNISEEDAMGHRLYDYEVIDIDEEVSFIIICPPAEFACAVPGQREILLQRGDLLSLPIQVFEMIHLNTYQNSIIQRYSRLSCILELDAATANHLHREAFSSTEVAIAKERLTTLQELQGKLNSIWKSVRWLIDVITFARDKSTSSVLIKDFLEKVCNKENSNSNPNLKRSLLQIPPRDSKIVKSTPGRGSWPGPGASNTIHPNTCLLMNEFSKSEQQLSCTNDQISASSQYLNVSDSGVSRKDSDGSYSGYFSDRMIPSRSEDMLFKQQQYHQYNRPKQSQSQSQSQSREQQVSCSSSKTINTAACSSISASTSPLLNVRPMFTGSLLSVNTMNTTNTTSDSMHSLSSDSDNSCPVPIGSSTPHKKHKVKTIAPSRSMQNMKHPTTFERKYSQQNHLRVDNSQSNLETTSSKSLSNLKTEDAAPAPTSTYLKPNDLETKTSTNKPDLIPDAIFKVPFTDTLIDAPTTSNGKEPPALGPGILQVYAAYETGLASGTSLKLHVTPRTSAREVVDLVVKQLNMAVVLKGKDGPIYTADKLKNFCLVAVIGARERCLRDDFKPLQLQNPWKKGRLYVRQKHDVLAALEHSSKHSTFI